MQIVLAYWPIILIAVALVLILALLFLRPRQRVSLTDSAPIRPHMQQSHPREGRGIAGEAATATTDLTGNIISAPVHRALEGDVPHDDLCVMKGVGPRFAEALRAAGFYNFGQLAGLTLVEVERLDAQLGAFRGRITRDQVVEQASYLSRNDVDGFEQRFGKF
jgi:predicted flap endonuclease-1-like 5' DNA nuclease